MEIKYFFVPLYPLSKTDMADTMGLKKYKRLWQRHLIKHHKQLKITTIIAFARYVVANWKCVDVVSMTLIAKNGVVRNATITNGAIALTNDIWKD